MGAEAADKSRKAKRLRILRLKYHVTLGRNLEVEVTFSAAKFQFELASVEIVNSGGKCPRFQRDALHQTLLPHFRKIFQLEHSGRLLF